MISYYVTTPCKDCTPDTGRTLGCHSKCEKYIEWKEICANEKRLIESNEE